MDAESSKDSKMPRMNKASGRKRKMSKDGFESDSSVSSNDSLVTASSANSDSSSENSDRCPICLCTFKKQDYASPEVCQHKFCLECLEEWSKVNSLF